MSLLFVPAGVGVMTHLALISQYGLRMLLVIVLSTLVGMVVTALVFHLTLVALVGARLMAELSRLSRHDSLTELLNRYTKTRDPAAG